MEMSEVRSDLWLAPSIGHVAKVVVIYRNNGEYFAGDGHVLTSHLLK